MEPAPDPINLHQFCLGDALPTVFYIPDYVSLQREENLLRKVYDAPSPKWKTVTGRRVQSWGGVVLPTGLISQTLPSWLSALTGDIQRHTAFFPTPINHVLVNEYLPGQGIMPPVGQLAVFQPSPLLSLHPQSHQDGPLYHPLVAILTLQGSAVMTFTPHSTQQTASPNSSDCLETTGPSFGGWRDEDGGCARGGGDGVRVEGGRELSENGSESLGEVRVGLEPRSLLLFKDGAYTDWLHGIEDRLDSKVLNWTALQRQRETMERNGGSESGRIWSAQTEGLDVRRGTTRVSLTCRTVLKTRGHFLRL